MLDNLRESASQSPFFNPEPPPGGDDPNSPTHSPPGKHFLGLTPVQRFILALMLFLMVCVFGTFLLVLTQRVWL